MNTPPWSFLFPLLFITAATAAGAAYQAKLSRTDDSYSRLQKTLEGIGPSLQKGSRIYVTNHSGEELFRAQLPIFLPFNAIIWQDTVRTGKDSLLTIQKKETGAIDTTFLQDTYDPVWHGSSGDYIARLWLRRR